MILEMITWGFFSAIGWMFATYTVDKIIPPDKPPAIEKKIDEKKNDS